MFFSTILAQILKTEGKLRKNNNRKSPNNQNFLARRFGGDVGSDVVEADLFKRAASASRANIVGADFWYGAHICVRTVVSEYLAL